MEVAKVPKVGSELKCLKLEVAEAELNIYHRDTKGTEGFRLFHCREIPAMKK